MKKKRQVVAVCIVLMALVGGLNLLDFLREAWDEGLGGRLIKPLGLAIMFGGLAISSYYREYVRAD